MIVATKKKKACRRMCSHGTLLTFYSVTKNLLHKRVSLVETIQRLHHKIRLESPRCREKLKMHCLIRCQLGLSLYDEALHLWRETPFETTLHLTNSVADARREIHESSSRCSRRLIQCHFGLYLWLSLQSLRTELICQSSTSRTNGERLVQFVSVLLQRRTGVMSPKIELAQPRS